MFIDKIVNAPDKWQNDILYLKNSALPILLFGAGIGAKKLLPVLNKHSVRIDHIVIDSSYFKANTFLEGYPVESIDDVLSKYSKVNIIIAFTESHKKAQELSTNPLVAKCIVPDGGCIGFDFPDYYTYAHAYSQEFDMVYNLLSDNLSRELMTAFVNAKISKDAEKLNLLNVKNELPYFPDFIHFSDNEIFVDCGAYDGDTLSAFVEKTCGKYSKIFAFEPDNCNLEKLRKNVENFDNIEIVEKGVFSCKDKLFFQSGLNDSSHISNDGNISIELDTIDNIVSGYKVSYIKMDIEGAELDALKGAQKTLLTNLPKMAIAIYHRPDHILTIPAYIQQIHSYKFYLRHYGLTTCELILYAIPNI